MGHSRRTKKQHEKQPKNEKEKHPMNDPFTGPATASGIDWNSLSGSLLLVSVHEVVDHIPTVHTKPGEKSPAIRCDIAILDGQQAGQEIVDTLVFPKVLQGQLRSRVGQKVLGRLGQGNAKPGQSAPWMLADATDADRQVGLAYLNKSNAAAMQQGSATAGGPPF